MVITLFFALLLIILLGIERSDFSNPAFSFNIVWLVVSIIPFLVDVSITYYTQSLISLSLFLFTVPFLLPWSEKLMNFKNSKFAFLGMYSKFSPAYINKLLIIELVIFILYLDGLRSLEVGDTIISIRDAMTESAKNGQLPLSISLGINIPIVFSCFVSVYSKGVAISKLFFFYVLSAAMVFLSFSKGYIITYALIILFSLYFHAVFSKKALCITALFFSSAVVGLFFFRDAHVDKNILFSMYTIAPTMALDTLTNGLFDLGFPVNGILKELNYIFGYAVVTKDYDEYWAPIEYPTNVYTAFGLVYNDFGYAITGFLFLIYGFLSLYAYRGVCNRLNSVNYYLYIWSMQAVLTSFFSDAFFGLFITSLKYIIILILLELYFRATSSCVHPIEYAQH